MGYEQGEPRGEKVIGAFRAIDRKDPNTYECENCAEAGVEHRVNKVPHGFTGSRSCWGPGIPTTRRECSACGCWDGPWVSADIVGGGW